MPRTAATTTYLVIALFGTFGPAGDRLASAQTLSRRMPGNLAGPLDDHIAWMDFHDYGWRAMDKGWYDTAQREFTEAVKIARRPSVNDARLLARSYSSLAWSLQRQGRNAEAEPLARWALETRRAYFGPNAEPLARSLNQVASIHLELQRFGAAEPLLREVLAMKSSGEDTMNLEKAQGASLLGLGLVTQRRYAEAETDFARAVEWREGARGPKDPELGDELNNLAWTQIEQGKLAEARSAMERSLKILAQARGESDPSVARALDGLTRVDIAEKDFGAAEAKFVRLIAIYRQPGGGQPARLQDALKRYADLLDRVGRAADAAKVREQLNTPTPTPAPAGWASSSYPSAATNRASTPGQSRSRRP